MSYASDTKRLRMYTDNMVFRNKQEEFKYKLEHEMKKKK